MCTYKGEKYVREQLDSILQQELPVDEIVVCDNGSKDETLAIVREITDKNPQVRWNIQQNTENLGVTKNFEKVLTLCSGEIIFLSDQNDVWYPNKTRKIVDSFRENPDKEVIFTDADFISDKGNLLSEQSLLTSVGLFANIEIWNSGGSMELLNVANRVTGATIALRSKFRTHCLPFAIKEENDSHEELHDEQIARIADIQNKLKLLPERLIGYRQHNNNVTGFSPSHWLCKDTSPSSMSLFVEPTILPGYLKLQQSPHLTFYMKRVANYKSVLGKMKLAFSLFQYWKYYNKYWSSFYISDLLYGINNSFRIKYTYCMVKRYKD